MVNYRKSAAWKGYARSCFRALCLVLDDQLPVEVTAVPPFGLRLRSSALGARPRPANEFHHVYNNL